MIILYRNQNKDLHRKFILRYKIIITGPVGAGKTTAINALTDNSAVQTDVAVSDKTTSIRKNTTTVALDYGVVEAGKNIAHVYGTPGQERFHFMWDIISQGAQGLIILLDNSRNYPLRDLKYYVKEFSPLIKRAPLILAITRYDECSQPSLSSYQQWVDDENLDTLVVKIDAREKNQVSDVVNELIRRKQIIDNPELAQLQPTLLPRIVESDVENIDSDNEVMNTSTNIDLTEESMIAVANIDNVTGVTLSNDVGDLIDSTIVDDELNDFMAFLSGMTPVVEDALKMGNIHRIMLRGPDEENLTLFVEESRTLGVTSANKVSVAALSQQVEDLLQWI
ncbi:MAG: ATP/GTP-binding protein [Thiotrichaceae bacterium]|nr:ATP/GTP-binding protein [Thiotrichaceae bacterium]